jgi:uncharacterized membrane protein
MRDKRKRSLLKTISWRIIATAITIGGVYVVTGNAYLSVSTGLGLNLFKAFAYYFHERAWERVEWGRISFKSKTVLNDLKKAVGKDE